MAAFLPWLTTLQAQLPFPSITDVTRESPAVVREGDTVAYRFNATPGAAAIESVTFSFLAEKNGTTRAIMTNDAASGRVSITLDSAWVIDNYRLEFITVRDEWARSVTYNMEGAVGGSTRTAQREFYYPGPFAHVIEFPELGFVVANGSNLPARTDLTRLELLTTTAVNPGQSMRFRTAGVTGAVPLSRIAVTFSHSSGLSLALTFTIDAGTPDGEWSVPITAAIPNGRYRLSSVITYDREGRAVVHRGDGLASESAGGIVRTSASSQLFFLFEPAFFTVEGGSATAPAAQLSRWERTSPDELTPGASLGINIAAQSGAFPVEQLSVRIIGPYGGTRTLTLAGADGSFSVPVTADWLNGPYTIGVVSLTDSVGRVVNYLPVGGSFALGGTTINGSPFPREKFMFSVRGGRDIRPYFVVQPEPATTLPSGRDAVSLNVLAVGVGPVTYQWYRGEVGDTSQPLPRDLVFPTQLTAAVTGPTTFWARATSAGSTVDSAPARVALRPRDFGRLTNLSVLTNLADANESFSFGCVAGGDGTTGTKQILVRAAGPSLAALGVAGTMADPRLQLYRGSTMTAENDNWGGTPALSAAMAAVGAFAYTAPTSRDAAALATFTAGANHSITISGTTGGQVIGELYDLGPNPAETAGAPRLINLSVLKQLGDGFTVGFSIGGVSPVKILVRAVGPGLAEAPFNIGNPVRDPRFALYRGPIRIAIADNWDSSGSSVLSDAFSAVGAFRLPSASKDAALVTTLAPGSYTVQVKASSGGGLVLVEVYEVP